MANEPQGRVTRPDELRPPMRPDPRSESLKRAETRAHELRTQPKTGLPSDVMKLDRELAPEGWTYELKRLSVYGQPDKQSQIGNAASGWDPVPVDRHPEVYIPPDCALMEKPASLVAESHEERKRATKAELRSQRKMLQEAPIDGARDIPGDRRASRNNEEYMAVRPNRVEE